MKLYKLTDERDQTYGGCQWGENVTVETSGQDKLCSSGFTHWYTHPLLAVFLNPVHARLDLATAHLWEGEGEPVKTDHGLKVGCARATTHRRVTLPVVSTAACVRFAVLCVQAANDNPPEQWSAWADRWLSRADRTMGAAQAAAHAARAAYMAVAEAAWDPTRRAAQTAAEAAYTAARAAAEAREAAAYAVVRAAMSAVQDASFDLAALAQRAVQEEGDGK